MISHAAVFAWGPWPPYPRNLAAPTVASPSVPTPDQPPESPEEARIRLAATPVEAGLASVLETLQAAGMAAVLVGGAVRDLLLGRSAVGDFDVATSARPEEVMGLFPRTIPTGVRHGTVTVLAGPSQTHVEVTTFRGEGAYADGRRPAQVRFLRDLEEALARRDFTVNALAWDPIGRVFSDPFGGLEDLRGRVIRAVGTPLDRFREDGLRTMRAVRFCAALGFTLEPETAVAIPLALDILAKVAAERIRVELWKLLGAPVPSLGLRPMAETGIWPVILPPVASHAHDDLVAAVDELPADPVLRLCALLLPGVLRAGDPAAALSTLDGLRPARAERRRASALLDPTAVDLIRADGAEAVRRAAARLGRKHLGEILALHRVSSHRRAEIDNACRAAPLEVRELAVTGGELVDAGIVTRGAEVGELLRALLDAALTDPSLNDRARLLERARTVRN